MELCEKCGSFFITKFQEPEKSKCQNCDDNQKLDIFQCLKCNIIFKSRRTLLNHKLLHNEKNYTCTICDKKFSLKRYLNSHLRIHKNVTIQCSICEKKFIDKSNYNCHILIHYPKLITCSSCDKMFHTKEYLKKQSCNALDIPYFPPLWSLTRPSQHWNC